MDLFNGLFKLICCVCVQIMVIIVLSEEIECKICISGDAYVVGDCEKIDV